MLKAEGRTARIYGSKMNEGLEKKMEKGRHAKNQNQ